MFSSAIIAYNEICPTRYDLLDACYRRMVSMLPVLEDSAQVVALTVLMKYARTQFVQPTLKELNAAGAEAKVVKVSVKPVAKKADALKSWWCWGRVRHSVLRG